MLAPPRARATRHDAAVLLFPWTLNCHYRTQGESCPPPKHTRSFIEPASKLQRTTTSRLRQHRRCVHFLDPTHTTAQHMQLIHVKSGTGNGADASSLLLGGIASGLLIPSVPLSDAAARQLHAVDAHNQQHQQHAGTLLKSLPVELLYDDRGLQLFDHVCGVA